jgi:glucan phosphoethanolaminetransferase (alkaline phosphatase superfamily)
MNCPQCGAEISGSANVCPRCGIALSAAPETVSAGATTNARISLLLAVLGAILTFVFLSENAYHEHHRIVTVLIMIVSNFAAAILALIAWRQLVHSKRKSAGQVWAFVAIILVCVSVSITFIIPFTNDVFGPPARELLRALRTQTGERYGVAPYYVDGPPSGPSVTPTQQVYVYDPTNGYFSPRDVWRVKQ